MKGHFTPGALSTFPFSPQAISRPSSTLMFPKLFARVIAHVPLSHPYVRARKFHLKILLKTGRIHDANHWLGLNSWPIWMLGYLPEP